VPHKARFRLGVDRFGVWFTDGDSEESPDQRRHVSRWPAAQLGAGRLVPDTDDHDD
jgi:hypothetical protein